MNFFDVRRVRVRPRYAHLYPTLASDVWLNAREVTRVMARRGPRELCRHMGCDGGRVLCDQHFEFRGGRPNPEGLRPRAVPAEVARV